MLPFPFVIKACQCRYIPLIKCQQISMHWSDQPWCICPLQTADGEESEVGSDQTLYVVETMKLEDAMDEENSNLSLIAGTLMASLGSISLDLLSAEFSSFLSLATNTELIDIVLRMLTRLVVLLFVKSQVLPCDMVVSSIALWYGSLKYCAVIW